LRTILRTKSISTKLTEKEYETFEAMAEASGQNLSEWARNVLLEQAQRNGSEQSLETLLAEVLGLRTIVLNLLYATARGQTMTEEQMKALIDRADAGKVERARKLLTPSNVPETRVPAEMEVQS
jgi:hypothetical protein